MKKILIANRGEIAIRIIRTLKRMGIETVAIYSEADRQAIHVRMADEAYCVGPAPSSASYLNIDKILEIAAQSGSDGIHPGYGFLSENAVFAEKVRAAGLIFIGPSPESISVMGSKLEAKAAVKKYDIPLVPGTDVALTDISEAIQIAKNIGFPILIKASAGGGGKGMRVVHSEADFESQLHRAVSEATAAFGDGAVFIEKYVLKPRHIEIQVLADTHGNTVHLFERECSIQRRHQKVVEEAPSCLLDEDLRQRMGAAAVMVAKACNYVGAGTVEFLVDANKNYYFLEMNTRLQVEHPVTEMVTGVDLVELQVRVAQGEALSIRQEALALHGHAIELRVYAEDPKDNFMPSIGTLTRYEQPTGEGIRLDDAFEEGMEIPIYYDPMIAKLVAWGRTRAEAIVRMKAAIVQYKIEGIETTLSFGDFVCNHPAFLSGDFDTHFIEKYYSKEEVAAMNYASDKIAALAGLWFLQKEQQQLKTIQQQDTAWFSKRQG